MAKLTSDKVLIYRNGRRNQSTVKKHYIEWRNSQNPPLPYRCDNTECMFFTHSIFWNGKPINLILDHINGVCGDNRPHNLRFLCPNCNSQQPTNGGGNKGRVQQSESFYTLLNDVGQKTNHHFLRTETVNDDHVLGHCEIKPIHNKK